MKALSAIQVHSADNVAVSVKTLEPGTVVTAGSTSVEVTEQIPVGHKIALTAIGPNAKVIKYGHVIGHATRAIARGEWVHSHNLATDLDEAQSYSYNPEPRGLATSTTATSAPTWLGYKRRNNKVGMTGTAITAGSAGTRNEIWVLNTVGCVNIAAERIARVASERFGKMVDGIHAFGHPYGCSQLGDDLNKTQRTLAGLMRHPNAGGVLVLGLGCESNQLKSLMSQASDHDPERIRFFNTQDVVDEIEEGVAAVKALVRVAQNDQRVECAVSELTLGMKCGGSDAFSGLTANPLTGRISEAMTGWGATTLLTEVPEMFGAEQQLMNRAADETTYQQLIDLIEGFKRYFTDHNQPVYENPSPGNRDGGITTLEEKSLGAVQKGGSAPVTQILGYGAAARPESAGLGLVEAPGNDAVSTTALVAAGASMVLFTSGRGTPLGTIVPTIKIATNNEIVARKPHWFDFNAGALLDGSATMDELSGQLLNTVLDVASGRTLARNEVNGQREIAIWKDGVTL